MRQSRATQALTRPMPPLREVAPTALPVLNSRFKDTKARKACFTETRLDAHVSRQEVIRGR
jgi:hypothetical protein